MKKCPHGGEVLGLGLRDFDRCTAIDNTLILIRELAGRRGITLESTRR
jgi:hypothetical protein